MRKLLTLVTLCLAGCLGVHSLGSFESAEDSRCCFSSITGTKVDSCPDSASCACAPELCGAGPACQLASDCPGVDVPCHVCTDGTNRCPTVECFGGRCVGRIPAACEFVPACDRSEDCAVPDACIQCADGVQACYQASCNHGACEILAPVCSPELCSPLSLSLVNPCPLPTSSCIACPDGTDRCATNDCVDGQCKVTYPSCPPPTAQCTVDADCPQLGVACQACWDGSSACPKSWCEAGVCRSALEQCPPKPECQVDADCTVPVDALCGPACCKAVCTASLQCQVTIVPCTGVDDGA